MGPTKKVKKSWKGFFVKKQEWAFLVSSIGLYSGQFARLLANGSSCQEESVRHISCPGEEGQGRRVAGGAPTKKAQPKEVQQQQRQESQEEAQEGEGVEENAEVQEGEELALDPESVDMGNPLTPAEEEVRPLCPLSTERRKEAMEIASSSSTSCLGAHRQSSTIRNGMPAKKQLQGPFSIGPSSIGGEGWKSFPWTNLVVRRHHCQQTSA